MLLHSDVARLVLGYLAEENCPLTYQAFASESSHLKEMRHVIPEGIPDFQPMTIFGKSLCVILHEYYAMKDAEAKYWNFKNKTLGRKQKFLQMWTKLEEAMAAVKSFQIAAILDGFSSTNSQCNSCGDNTTKNNVAVMPAAPSDLLYRGKVTVCRNLITQDCEFQQIHKESNVFQPITSVSTSESCNDNEHNRRKKKQGIPKRLSDVQRKDKDDVMLTSDPSSMLLQNITGSEAMAVVGATIMTQMKKCTQTEKQTSQECGVMNSSDIDANIAKHNQESIAQLSLESLLQSDLTASETEFSKELEVLLGLNNETSCSKDFEEKEQASDLKITMEEFQTIPQENPKVFLIGDSVDVNVPSVLEKHYDNQTLYTNQELLKSEIKTNNEIAEESVNNAGINSSSHSCVTNQQGVLSELSNINKDKELNVSEITTSPLKTPVNVQCQQTDSIQSEEETDQHVKTSIAISGVLSSGQYDTQINTTVQNPAEAVADATLSMDIPLPETNSDQMQINQNVESDLNQTTKNNEDLEQKNTEEAVIRSPNKSHSMLITPFNASPAKSTRARTKNLLNISAFSKKKQTPKIKMISKSRQRKKTSRKLEDPNKISQEIVGSPDSNADVSESADVVASGEPHSPLNCKPDFASPKSDSSVGSNNSRCEHKDLLTAVSLQSKSVSPRKLTVRYGLRSLDLATTDDAIDADKNKQKLLDNSSTTDIDSTQTPSLPAKNDNVTSSRKSPSSLFHQTKAELMNELLVGGGSSVMKVDEEPEMSSNELTEMKSVEINTSLKDVSKETTLKASPSEITDINAADTQAMEKFAVLKNATLVVSKEQHIGLQGILQQLTQQVKSAKGSTTTATNSVINKSLPKVSLWNSQQDANITASSMKHAVLQSTEANKLNELLPVCTEAASATVSVDNTIESANTFNEGSDSLSVVSFLTTTETPVAPVTSVLQSGCNAHSSARLSYRENESADAQPRTISSCKDNKTFENLCKKEVSGDSLTTLLNETSLTQMLEAVNSIKQSDNEVEMNTPSKADTNLHRFGTISPSAGIFSVFGNVDNEVVVPCQSEEVPLSNTNETSTSNETTSLPTSAITENSEISSETEKATQHLRAWLSSNERDQAREPVCRNLQFIASTCASAVRSTNKKPRYRKLLPKGGGTSGSCIEPCLPHRVTTRKQGSVESCVIQSTPVQISPCNRFPAISSFSPIVMLSCDSTRSFQTIATSNKTLVPVLSDFSKTSDTSCVDAKKVISSKVSEKPSQIRKLRQAKKTSRTKKPSKKSLETVMAGLKSIQNRSTLQGSNLSVSSGAPTTTNSPTIIMPQATCPVTSSSRRSVTPISRAVQGLTTHGRVSTSLQSKRKHALGIINTEVSSAFTLVASKCETTPKKSSGPPMASLATEMITTAVTTFSKPLFASPKPTSSAASFLSPDKTPQNVPKHSGDVTPMNKSIIRKSETEVEPDNYLTGDTSDEQSLRILTSDDERASLVSTSSRKRKATDSRVDNGNKKRKFDSIQNMSQNDLMDLVNQIHGGKKSRRKSRKKKKKKKHKTKAKEEKKSKNVETLHDISNEPMSESSLLRNVLDDAEAIATCNASRKDSGKEAVDDISRAKLAVSLSSSGTVTTSPTTLVRSMHSKKKIVKKHHKKHKSESIKASAHLTPPKRRVQGKRRVSLTSIPIPPSKLGGSPLHLRTPSPVVVCRDSPKTIALVAESLVELSKSNSGVCGWDPSTNNSNVHCDLTPISSADEYPNPIKSGSVLTEDKKTSSTPETGKEVTRKKKVKHKSKDISLVNLDIKKFLSTISYDE